jgi:molybdopterin/thiamine biosynthesis adenylyltransferase
MFFMKSDDANRLEVGAGEAAGSITPDRPLIDIRPELQKGLGVPFGALSMSEDEVLSAMKARETRKWEAAYILCAQGVRSLALVRRLSDQGLDSVFSVSGGFRAWSEAGLAIEYPGSLNAGQAERYARHLVMPQVGPDGQSRLLRSRILLVGLGGLNSPAALYLAAAGVGTLGLVDDDRVERSNLQRQIIHREDGIGGMKVQSAQKSIQALNPETEVCLIERRVTDDNAADLVSGWDVVIDGTDNFPSRYALNSACVAHGIPLVYGAVMRFQGQVSVFWPASPEPVSGTGHPCFQCLVPSTPPPGEAPACADAGVLGVLPGIVGTLQATEALKLVLGVGESLIGRLLMFDALTMDFRQTRLAGKPGCKVCGQGRE